MLCVSALLIIAFTKCLEEGSPLLSTWCPVLLISNYIIPIKEWSTVNTLYFKKMVIYQFDKSYMNFLNWMYSAYNIKLDQVLSSTA